MVTTSLFLLFTFFGLEVYLRFTHPEIGNVAESYEVTSLYRIHRNPTDELVKRVHPDTKKAFPLIYNNQGLRQGRDFTQSKSKGTIRIGFYGDSFTENVGMRSQYSFSEPLDYYLNKIGSYEVMNFGNSGYGTDQSYLFLEETLDKLDIDHVFYVYCSNDFIDNLADDLFRINDEGKLQYSVPKINNSPVKRIIRSLYTSYYLMSKFSIIKEFLSKRLLLGFNTSDHWVPAEKSRRYAYSNIVEEFDNGIESPDVQRARDLLLKLVLAMKDYTEIRDKTFTLVTSTCGSQNHHDKLFSLFDKYEVSYFDLLGTLLKDRTVESLRFENDGHWNEDANRLVARELFNYFGRKQNLPIADFDMNKAESEYYSSFNDSPYRFRDIDMKFILSPKQKAIVRRKYLSKQYSLIKTRASGNQFRSELGDLR